MAEIQIDASPTSDGWTCSVEVTEPNGSTRHTVTVRHADRERLTGGATVSPEELVERSFEFLLEREPKESILRRFDLPVIERYFPEYPAEIRRRLGASTE